MNKTSLSGRASLLWVLIILLVNAGCHVPSSSKHSISNALRKDSIDLTWTLMTDDLTEDVSRMSSGNDEIMLLGYLTTDSCLTSWSFIKMASVFNKDVKQYQGQASFCVTSAGQLVFLLIEIDSEKSINEFEPAICKNLKHIISAYSARNQLKLNSYLQDDDLLGIKAIAINRLKTSTQEKFLFEGIHLFDQYVYTLILTCN